MTTISSLEPVRPALHERGFSKEPDKDQEQEVEDNHEFFEHHWTHFIIFCLEKCFDIGGADIFSSATILQEQSDQPTKHEEESDNDERPGVEDPT